MQRKIFAEILGMEKNVLVVSGLPGASGTSSSLSFLIAVGIVL